MFLINGIKLVLRDWIEEDVPEYSKWQTLSAEWQKLDGPYYRSSDRENEERIKKLKNSIVVGEFSNPRTRLVVADKTSSALLGTVNCYWESKETNWLCAGITIFDPQHWGQGLGHEALGLWVEYLFKSRPEIIRLDLRTWSGNEGMIKLAVKLGFMQEACFRKARIVDNKYYDGLGFGILRPEWEENHSEGFLESLPKG